MSTENYSVFDDPPFAKAKPGRPHAVAPATFEDALIALDERAQQFVRHVLAGKTQTDAYRAVTPKAVSDRVAQVGGAKLARRKPVAHALRLGREAGAVQAITGLKLDLDGALQEMEAAKDFALKTENATAYVRACELRAKLMGLLVDRQQIEQASLVVNISGVDTSRLVNRERVIDGQTN